MPVVEILVAETEESVDGELVLATLPVLAMLTLESTIEYYLKMRLHKTSMLQEGGSEYNGTLCTNR